MHEISIVVFTLLVQISVGMSLAFAVGREQFTVNQSKSFLFAICAVACIGLTLSLTHLGYVWNAPFAITHFMTSWLSREILLTSAFLGCLGLSFLIYVFKNTLVMPLVLAGVAFGIADVYAMSRIYTAASVAIWQSWATYAGFFGVALVGFCLSAISINLSKKKEVLIWPIALLALGMLVRIIAQFDMLSGLDAEVESLGILFPIRSEVSFREFIPQTCVAWGLYALSVSGLMVMAKAKKASVPMAVGLSAGIVIAEFILRIGFYSF
ncbi:dimethyl sulfoxide reductase anchor subunit family protein [Vibrio alginolyticus]|uniref:dimethyl sulfoxide reductase anchor subunit family protein n=1 Tax=Vibrio alginolyticus TaxID=663 RepID=UPI003D7EECD3